MKYPCVRKTMARGGHYGSQMYRCGHATALRMIIFFKCIILKAVE